MHQSLTGDVTGLGRLERPQAICAGPERGQVVKRTRQVHRHPVVPVRLVQRPPVNRLTRPALALHLASVTGAAGLILAAGGIVTVIDRRQEGRSR
jgi:hypothetical protein